MHILVMMKNLRGHFKISAGNRRKNLFLSAFPRCSLPRCSRPLQPFRTRAGKRKTLARPSSGRRLRRVFPVSARFAHRQIFKRDSGKFPRSESERFFATQSGYRRKNRGSEKAQRACAGTRTKPRANGNFVVAEKSAGNERSRRRVFGKTTSRKSFLRKKYGFFRRRTRGD